MGTADYIRILEFKIFFAAAKYKNFSMAAEEMHMSPTLVSKNIARMEEELGFSLFTRTTRSVELTPAGEYLYLNCPLYISGLESCCNEGYRLQQNFKQTISIGAMNTADMNKFLFPYTNRYLGGHTDMKISIVSEYMSDLVMGVNLHMFDLAIVADFLISMAEKLNLKWQYWAKSQSNVLMPRSNPLSEKDIVTLEDIKDEVFSFIGGVVHQEYMDYICDIMRPYNPNIKIGRIYENPYTLRDTFEQDGNSIFFTDQYFSYNENDIYKRLTVSDHQSGVIVIWNPNNRKAEDFLTWFNQNFPIT